MKSNEISFLELNRCRCNSTGHVYSLSFGAASGYVIGNKAERLLTLPINSPKGQRCPLGGVTFSCYFSYNVISEAPMSSMSSAPSDWTWVSTG
jgi:hypothetical protein